MQDTMLKSPDAAKQLGITEARLRYLRSIDHGPEWVTIGPRTVRYRQSAVDAYLVAQTHIPATSKVSA